MKNDILKREVSRDNYNSSKNKLYSELSKMDKDEINSRISCLRFVIKTLTSKEFLKEALDVDEIPESLVDYAGGLEMSKLNESYLLYKHGKYNGYKLMCETEKVFSEVFREFNELVEMFVYGKVLEKEGANYERT